MPSLAEPLSAFTSAVNAPPLGVAGNRYYAAMQLNLASAVSICHEQEEEDGVSADEMNQEIANDEEDEQEAEAESEEGSGKEIDNTEDGTYSIPSVDARPTKFFSNTSHDSDGHFR